MRITKACLFCGKRGPYTKLEHIIPQALGNDELILAGEVCDACNQYFGKEVEEFVLAKSPFAFWRTFLGIRKKGGAFPHIDLSYPCRQKGRLKAIHPLHDNLVGFTCCEDYSVSVDIDDDKVLREILDGTRNQFTFVFTPQVLSMMGRFLCKVGVELVCSVDPSLARSNMFTMARQFSRYGNIKSLWPIFHACSGDLKGLKKTREDKKGFLEEVFCFRYRLLDVPRSGSLLALTVGADTWVVRLDDPWPTPIIQSAFPGQEMKLIWYRI